MDSSPVLLPKDALLRREASPDSIASGSRVVLRRHSTKPGVVGRQGAYSPLAGGSDHASSPDSDGPSAAGGSKVSLSGAAAASGSVPVPFPRSVSAAAGDHAGTPSPRSSTGLDNGDRPRFLRGRFQSDVEGSARRKERPNSYDELSAASPRLRFESMVNLGGPSAHASASDLLARDSVDGSAVRMRLIVREDGKPPTHFQLGNCIGRGQFGSVYRALNLNTGQMVAVKRIRLEGLKEEEVTTLMREVHLVKSLSHPSIVKYEGMARDDDTLSIVLEYAENGSLGQTLKAFGKLNERLVASYVVKILEGLHYLHTSDVVHCDLKAANILTTKNGNVKLSDFGVSLNLRNLRAMEQEVKDVAGTPNWMAPEVIELKGASTKSDIWSLGCTVIELLTGRPPYAEIANSMSVMFRIVEDDMPPIPEDASDLLKHFLEQCFNKDPTQRPSAEILCEHPWLKKNWVALKELRPQDSIPFLRRVSTDLHKQDAVHYLAQLDIPDSPISGSPAGQISPIARRTSAASVRPLDNNDFAPRDHSFVKTTFSKRTSVVVDVLTGLG
ncbi:Pkinase-domain-containing protein [Pholiota conissans]|uniref:Pkinase-domain-containing protein n=1 Tax=Pholiota conissans TaxID=109636 RepID=A0A9P5Z6J0_9AGAR|nr:Pkinase-domain-containing protein [Pholiota conissans]